MQLKGLSGGIYRPLSPEDIATIHDASLMILENTGITYEAGLEELLGMLRSAGAHIDNQRARITFPREMVQEHLEKAPSRVVLYGRGKGTDLDLQDHHVYLGTGGAAINILDLESGVARPTTLEDLFNIGRLVDKLDNIHFFLRPCIPTDIPEDAYDLNVFYTCFRATAKHVMAGVNDEAGFQQVMELATTIAASQTALTAKPFFSIIASFCISPLKLCTQSTKIMQTAIRHGIPVALSAAPMAGSTSPMTMAGTLAQLHAEQLAGICICQLTNPGAPLLYGGIPGMANMSSMAYRGGGVECGIMNAAIHQMAHHIRVPNYNSAGLTDSKLPDAQAGWEKACTVLLATMGGSNFIHHAAGMLESMLTVAYEQYVIDDEIIGMCCKVLKGIDINAESLALEVIDGIGPGGNFMTTSHTLDNLRSEYFSGNGLTDCKSRDAWIFDGAQDARERARIIVKKILATKTPGYIPSSLDQTIREKYNIRLMPIHK